AAEDARAHVTHGPCHSSPAQGAIDMNRSTGDDLCARRNRADAGHVAIEEHDRLTRADWPLDHQRIRLLAARRRLGASCRASALQKRRHLVIETIGLRIFEAHDLDAALTQALDQLRDFRPVERYLRQVKDDRFACEKIGRALAPLLKLREPGGNRRVWDKNKCEERPAT